MKTLFDTNIFRDVQRGTITKEQVLVARKKVQGNGYVSPLSLVELGSHVCEEEKGEYETYRRAFEAITELCDHALADPEMFMRKEVFNHPTGGHGLSPEDTMRVAALIAQTKQYERLAAGQVTLWGDTPARVLLNTGYLKQFRDKYETRFLADMEDHVFSNLLPNHKAERAAGRMPHLSDPALLTKFKAFLNSPQFEDLFFLITATRVNVLLLGTKFDSEWDLAAKSKLADYFAAYRWILSKIAEAGYNMEKHKNDYNDVHFLVYLADPCLTFVTHDGGISQKVGDAPSKARILSFSDWISG
jgi:hypothetical protein